MIKLIQQEIYKLGQKRSTTIGVSALAGFMVILAILSKVYPNLFNAQAQFESLFASQIFIVFMLIAATSNIMMMEFQSGMIRPLLYRRYSRTQVLISKWLVILGYSILLFVGAIIWSLLIKVVLFNNTFALTGKMMTNLLQGVSAQWLTLWLLLSLVFLITNAFRSSAAAVSIGIIGYFVTYITAALMFGAIARWSWLRFNPLNMLNLSAQVSDGTMEKLTQLSTSGLVIGNLIYIAIFLYLGLVLFKRRAV
ncbi:ABC transporter permease [Lacticaseibacillus brantae]|uniref:ABC transporter permease n=1 Tax=Lacticaseibacillus brantae DSM 23927 TaxID=1423727 RepID=A0A0R2AY68_9LACO|nr:ABC transporter permease [Lacticaseibacillus brantae]KRM71991.1 hypothetical protein FC34_GL000973 [Lacticaseibacillus brantae DSM 23927]